MSSSYIFYNELGVEPVGYVGLIFLEAEIENSIHTLEIDEIVASFPLEMESSIHDVINESEIQPSIAALIYDSIHKTSTYNKFNASVSLVCGRYLHTPFKERYLDTPYENRVAHTEFESRYLHVPFINC